MSKTQKINSHKKNHARKKEVEKCFNIENHQTKIIHKVKLEDQTNITSDKRQPKLLYVRIYGFFIYEKRKTTRNLKREFKIQHKNCNHPTKI